MRNTLDIAIKKAETGKTDGGYELNTNNIYTAYMTKKEWKAFESGMKSERSDAYKRFGAGSGGEMKEGKNHPPKMASYGSSSRMIYNLFRKDKNFFFEYKLHTRIGGTANLDGFKETEERYIFVEAKCHEFYGKSGGVIKSNYKSLYEYINEKGGCNLQIDIKEAGDKMDVDFFVTKEDEKYEVTRFDIKQMICHLLGIAMHFLKTPATKRILFVYLCFNPGRIFLESVKKSDILGAYDRMCVECNSISFKRLFEIIVEYLAENFRDEVCVSRADINRMISGFEFVLCDQADCFDFI